MIGLSIPTQIQYILDDSALMNIIWVLFVPVLFSYILCGITRQLIETMKVYLFKRGLKGKDLGRLSLPNENEEIPSALGVVTACTFLIGLVCLHTIDNDNDDRQSKYIAATLAICLMVLLGFADDVLDLPWRFKLALPPIAALPLINLFTGGTNIVLPFITRSWFWNFTTNTPTLLMTFLSYFGIEMPPSSHGAFVNIHGYYYLYMCLLSTFCTNSINIYAGINGLEVGQAIIIAFAILCTNIYEILVSVYMNVHSITSSTDSPTTIEHIHDVIFHHPHILSIGIMLLFIGTNIPLFQQNWFPAKLFVGDTFCYFAGMTFAVVGILCGFSKTVLLYFIPQIINFIYSCPQLFKYYPCPRHRLPGVDPTTRLRHPSTFVDKNGIVRDNMTLINLVLRIAGPMTEEELTTKLLQLQVICCAIGFIARYYIGPFWLYDGK